MDTRTFEDFTISEDMIGEDKKFLKEGTDIISVWHNHNIVDINLPIFMDLKIKHTEPGIKGDTAKGSFKPATLETGAVIQIPLFVNRGDTIRIDTRTGEYIERV
jgi:elongation factor P